MLTQVKHSIPSKDGFLDWDCAGAIDVPAMADALSYIRQHAEFPVRVLSLMHQLCEGNRSKTKKVEKKER